MPATSVTGRIAQSKFGTTASISIARKRSTRGLSIRHSRNSPSRNSTAIVTSRRRSGRWNSSGPMRVLATGQPILQTPLRPGSGIVVDHMPKLFLVFQRFPGAEGNTIQ
jgi:hypothetical protein